MEEIRAKFSNIEDKGHASSVKHKLVDVLILVMGAVISGISEPAGML